jgi:hypothetical protein
METLALIWLEFHAGQQRVRETFAQSPLPGIIVKVVKEDRATGMSKVDLGGLIKPLWTYTKFLTARPVRDSYGIIEMPENSGLITNASAE